MLKSLQRPLDVAVFFSLFLPLPLAAAPAKYKLSCTMQMAASLKADQPALLRFSIKNMSRHTLWLLDWNTPLEGWKNRHFELHGPKGLVEYQGPMFKRGPAQPTQYRMLEPGSKLDAEVDLRQVYALETPGRYRLKFTGLLHDISLQAPIEPRALDAMQSMPLRCPELSFKLLP